MADNVAVTPGSGATMAADDIGGVMFQRVKLGLGADGTANDLDGTAARGAYVDPRSLCTSVQVQSAGLTTATTAYTGGDQLGTGLTFASAVRANGGSGTIQTALLLDAALIVGAVDLYLFNAAVTPAADNAAASFSDADMLNCIGVLTFPPGQSAALSRIATITPGLQFKAGAGTTSIYGYLVTRAGHTFFGAVTDLTTTLVILQD